MNREEEFAEGVASWRRMLSAVSAAEVRVNIFTEAAARVANHLGNGIERAVVADTLADMATAYLADVDQDQIQQIIAHAFARAERQAEHQKSNGEDRQQPIKLIQSSAEFVKNFVPPDYLIDGILQRRFLYSFTGKTGSGKTAVVLLIAASVALGRKIGDIEVEQGRVLYFAGENPDDVRMRWIAMSQQMDFDADTIDVCFIPGRYEISKMRERILTEMRKIGEVVLIIIDTSAAYYEGKEVNSNTEMAEHARRFRTLIDFPGGPCVLANCHPVKNASADNLLPLGAGSFLNEVDGNLTCLVDYPAIEVHWQGKFRGADFDPLNFRLHSVTHEKLQNSKGRPIPTVVAKHLSENEKEAIEQANRSDEQRLLAEIERDGKASYSEYASRCGFLKTSGEPNKSKASNMIYRKLKKDKWITGEPGRYVLTPTGRSMIEDAEIRA